MSIATLPSPYGIKYSEWSAIVVEQMSGEGIAAAGAEDDWRDWAADVCESSFGVPEPIGFVTWQDWGAALVGTL